jgi:NitT/TauT family transport system ATP-binding protein
MNVAVPLQKTTDVLIRGVTKVFRRSPAEGDVHALGPIDLELRAGEFFAVVGPSGCGKSSLLEIIAGISEPTEGEILFEGKPIRGRVPEGVGVVFQEDACFPWMDVSANIAMGLHNMPIDGAEREQRVQGALEMMGLTEFRASYPTQLSGGMRQRVCIARTMVMAPRLILLDEPFGALDQQTRLLMGEEMLKLWRRVGTTIFLITHALDEAAMLADRIGVMSARPGRLLDIIETGWPVERTSEVVTRPEFGQITARLWRGLREESLKAIRDDRAAP